MIIDATKTPLGRISSFAAKKALQGNDVIIINCEKAIITGSKKNYEKKIKETRRKIGVTQQGPKISLVSEKIVKRTIRGMLPDHREGRGRVAFKRIKCYTGVPKEFEKIKPITIKNTEKLKYSFVEEYSK